MNAFPAAAACAGHPEPLWDESVHGETSEAAETRIDAGIAICRQRCPVRSECLADVDWSCDEGVRGGRFLPKKKTAYRPLRDWPAYARKAAS